MERYLIVEALDEYQDGVEEFEVIAIRPAKKGELLLHLDDMEVLVAGNDQGKNNIIVRRAAPFKEAEPECICSADGSDGGRTGYDSQCPWHYPNANRPCSECGEAIPGGSTFRSKGPHRYHQKCFEVQQERVRAFTGKADPSRCKGCATQSKNRADHLPQCSWLDAETFAKKVCTAHVVRVADFKTREEAEAAPCERCGKPASGHEVKKEEI